MTQSVDVRLFFNFRSPYCYLASKRLFRLFDDYHANLVWRPLGGWSGRSSPERAKVKVPLTRQDIRRFARKLGIPVNPPPITTDPTLAGRGSLLAEERGRLRAWVVEVMRKEWAFGQDIGQRDVLLEVARDIGLDPGELDAALDDPARQQRLDANWEEAQRLGVIGVPTWVVGEEIFWGNDRLEFVEDHLKELALARL